MGTGKYAKLRIHFTQSALQGAHGATPKPGCGVKMMKTQLTIILAGVLALAGAGCSNGPANEAAFGAAMLADQAIALQRQREAEAKRQAAAREEERERRRRVRHALTEQAVADLGNALGWPTCFTENPRRTTAEAKLLTIDLPQHRGEYGTGGGGGC